MTEHRTAAAQYIRMSTDAQDLSPAIQAEAIKIYSVSHGMDVVASYEDLGRSGLTLKDRSGMRRLLEDVSQRSCPFKVILVYDVSRWGRFQDTDASAYYEYHCRLHGVQVQYVQELFASSDTPLGNVLKSLKRAMAAEYSRELSVKTRAGHKAAIDAGFHVGGLPCIGLGRVAVAKHGNAERALAPGEHKAATREHVRWVRGSDEEAALVRRIFEAYATSSVSIQKLARTLQSEGVTSAVGKPVTPWMLYSLLRCEALIGNFVWGREHQGRRIAESDPHFRRVEGCIEPTIGAELWNATQRKRAKRAGTILSRSELLAFLEEQVKRNPQFNASDLRECGGPSRMTFNKHFGSFAGALACLGRTPARTSAEEYVRRNRVASAARHFRQVVQDSLAQHGVLCRPPRRCGLLLLVNESVRVRFQVIRRGERHGVLQWLLRKVYRDHFDYMFLVRLEEDGTAFDSLLMDRNDYFAFDLWFGDGIPPGFCSVSTSSDAARVFRSLRPLAVQLRSRSAAGVLGTIRRDNDQSPIVAAEVRPAGE